MLPREEAMTTTRLEPRAYALHVEDAVLVDLRERIDRVRWPDEPPEGQPWQFGTDLTYLQELVAYWRSEFDWRAQEQRLNALQQYTAQVAGIDVHFVHVPGNGPNPMPLLLSHGWPGSIWEFHKLIPLLTDPLQHGGDPNDAFTVIAPSLPGYTLSFMPGQRRFSTPEMADAFAELMHDVLGYQKFSAQGGDWGAHITAYLGYKYPDRLHGIHLNLLPLRRDPVPASELNSPEMQAWQAELDNWVREESGYGAIQGTRPQTLAYGLTDSPVGLAAWIVEKYRVWSDCGGDVERRFSKDDLLTTIMLYWTTGAIGSSFWPYYARQHQGWPLPADSRVAVPTAYASFPRDILHPPRIMAERAFNIQRWTVFPTGGHFAGLEEPEALAADLREFFRPMRSA